MNKEIKQKLASNWFKLLQDIICNDIEKLEGDKIKFDSEKWKGIRPKMKVEVNSEF